ARGRHWVAEMQTAGAELELRLDSRLEDARRQVRETWTATIGGDTPAQTASAGGNGDRVP
ncbi:MAG: hypothetical protein R3190_14360, partial [Thermoanaerobaculia bacterium]|nr:hypothetical protein [Thermoanaerobaculia bacterium]